MMITNKKAPSIRFEGFEEEWAENKLGEIFYCDIPTNTLSRASLSNNKGEIKNIHYGDILIKYNSFLSVSEKNISYITCGNIVDFKQQFLKDGDIVFADAAEDEIVGKSVEIGNVANDCVVAGLHTIATRPLIKFEKYYLGYYLNSNSFHDQLIFLMQGTKVLSISKTNLKKALLRYPISNEQAKIGHYFNKLDGLIQLQEQKLEKVINLKKAMLEKMLPKEGADMPEIRFKGFTEKWEKKKLKQIAGNYYGGGTPSTSNSGYWNGDIPWIQSSDLKEDTLLKLSVKKYVTQLGLKQSATKLIPKNSIAIVTRVGVGKLCIVPFKFTTSQDFFTLSNLNIEVVFGVFAISKTIQRELHAVQGTSIKGITKDELLSKEINVPSNKVEQQKIGEYFQNLDQLINQSQQKIVKLKHLKQALLQKIFI
jgi:type I restriction enzyme S subunit